MTDAATHEYRSNPTPHIYINWEFMIEENFFREGMETLIEMMEEHKTGKILSNVTQLGPLSDEDQKWCIDSWLPRALAIGYSSIANIISEDIFGKMAIEDILNNAAEKSPIKIQYFDNEEKAVEWLASLES
jgi:formate dehydrogenase maturation protein FdhE